MFIFPVGVWLQFYVCPCSQYKDYMFWPLAQTFKPEHLSHSSHSMHKCLHFRMSLNVSEEVVACCLTTRPLNSCLNTTWLQAQACMLILYIMHSICRWQGHKNWNRLEDVWLKYHDTKILFKIYRYTSPFFHYFYKGKQLLWFFYLLLWMIWWMDVWIIYRRSTLKGHIASKRL